MISKEILTEQIKLRAHFGIDFGAFFPLLVEK